MTKAKAEPSPTKPEQSGVVQDSVVPTHIPAV